MRFAYSPFLGYKLYFLRVQKSRESRVDFIINKGQVSFGGGFLSDSSKSDSTSAFSLNFFIKNH